MPLHITAISKTDLGAVRERNEDSVHIAVSPGPQGDTALLVVADGMGGYRAGDRASQIAIETIRRELEPLFGPSSLQPTVKLRSRLDPQGDRSTLVLPETANSEHYGSFLTRAVRRANEVIIAYGQEHREARGLGSTVTMAVVAKGRAYFANVGDSRAYLFRAGELRAITRDHSLVARLVEDGEIEPDEVYSHPKRNLIYRSLGTNHEEVEVDLFEEDLLPGDMLLLCSDGLWEKIRGPELIALLRGDTDLAAIGDRLVALANANGGEDNITLALALCAGVAEAAKPAESAADITEADTGELPTTGK